MRITEIIRRIGPVACALAIGALVLLLAGREAECLAALGSQLRGVREDLGVLSAYAEESRELGAAAARSRAAVDRSLARLSTRIAALGDEVTDLSTAIGRDRSGSVIAAGTAAAPFDAGLDRRIRAADTAFRVGDYGTAVASYSVLLVSAPEEPSFIERRAISLYKANPADSSSYGLIENDLGKLASEGSLGSEALETLALIFMERGEWNRAVDAYADLVRSRPDDLDLLIAACDCALLCDDPIGAARFLELARVSAGTDPRYDSEISRIRTRLSEIGAAAR